MNQTDSQNRKKLDQIIKDMEGQPVLVIGDIMLDRFIYGSVDRISPESPVPVLTIKREDQMLGGAGNALSSLAGLKTKPVIVSVTGHDSEADKIFDQIQALGCSLDGLVKDGSRPTTVKTRFLAGHQQLLRSDFEKKQPVSKKVEDLLVENIQKFLPAVKAVLISDYGKGMLTKSLLRKTIDAAKSKNIPVIVDPKGNDYSVYAGATAVTPNKKELCDATHHMPVQTDADVIKAAQHLIEKADIENIIATRSQDGMSVIRKDNDMPVHLRTAAQEVFDVSGAGDVVIATITGAMAAGAYIVEAAQIANIAGGIAVSKVGTTPIRADELMDALHENDQSAANGYDANGLARARKGFICKNDQWEEALEHVQRWRARGMKIGFTNGCFDIVHLGHVSYLNETRNHCDRLIVGLNIDASVSALKGESRPVNDELSRSSVLAALGAVDMVVLFGGQTKDDDQTANAILQKLQPDVYFKGGDYKVDDIPETPLVRSYGGDVKVLSAFDGYSTTASIERMNNKAA